MPTSHQPPSRYVVWYEDERKIAAILAKYGVLEDIYPGDIATGKAFNTLRQARAFAKKVRTKGAGYQIYERKNVVEYVLERVPRIVEYEWEDELVEDA
jgi:hypothetical protein